MANVTQTQSGIGVPPGNIIVQNKWRCTDLVNKLQGTVNVLYEEDLGVLDFKPSNDNGVVYIAEADLVGAINYKQRLVRLRKANNHIRGFAIVEKTPVSKQYFQAVQSFAVLELGLVVVQVTSQTEAANILIQMVLSNNAKSHGNPFMAPRGVTGSSVDLNILSSLQMIPKLGEVKAKALLETFKSIQGIESASQENLEKIVGKAGALHIRNFFDKPP
ncbi:unnamed protein product [Owenia fusiformis]|uniref:Uncharacterized protein n=1 Tax=Owenia fusiformis TaxID=6347 RepID=A0A8J1TUA2_OWEFU|nr:unnamed protein product [Owenia fusiformis]